MENPSFKSIPLNEEQLKQVATHDWLTGLLNRGTSELAIKSMFSPGDAILICDLDGFKTINDRYGHLTGDDCLKAAAKLFRYIMRSHDLVGRIGGDEFIIYAQGQQTTETLKAIKNKIQRRFDSYNEQAAIAIHVSVGASLITEDDTYESAFVRADEDLYKEKKKKHSRNAKGIKPIDSWNYDIEHIQEELVEQIQAPGGAYCQNYESFKTVFRHLERCMRRSDQSACVVLLSLTAKDTRSLDPVVLRERMRLLDRILQHGLRMGDIYTQYSSSQYLVLLTDVDLSLSELVSNRIRQSYYEKLDNHEADLILVHYSYKLEAAKLILD